MTLDDVQALAPECRRPEAVSAAAIGPGDDLIRETFTHISPGLEAA